MAIKNLGKRGIIFTLMAIIVVTIVLLAIRPPLFAPMEQRLPVIQSRVGMANEHLYNLQHIYLKLTLVHSGYRALNAYIKYMNKSGDEPANLEELNQDFFEIITNNSVNKVGLNSSTYNITLVENNTLIDKLREFSNISEEFLNLQTSVSIQNVELFQSNLTGPWQIGLKMDTTIYLNGSIATWNVAGYDTIATFRIIGFEDYYYLINTRALPGGPYRNYVVPTEVTQWNLTTFMHHIGNRTYKYDVKAPSFLSRLFNSVEASACCGIESIIYPGWASYPSDNMSFIDYCYFGRKCDGSDPGGNFSLFRVTNLTSGAYPFKIEPYHFAEARYNLTYKEGILIPD